MSSYNKALSLLRTGPSRPTLYSIEIPNLSRGDSEYLQMFCKSVNIPSVSHEVVTVLGQSNMGVQRNQPTMFKFGNPVSLEVIENSRFSAYRSLRELFDQTGLGSNPSNIGQGRNAKNQRMNYYDFYTFDMTLTKLEYPDNGAEGERLALNDPMSAGYKKIMKFEFQKCYVTAMNEIPLNSDRFDQFLTFKTNISYETYHTSNIDESYF